MSAAANNPQQVIDELRAANRKLEQALQENSRLQADRFYLASIVDGSTDAILSSDMDGQLTSCNAAALRLFGYDAAELSHQPVSRLIPPERRHEEQAIMARIRRGETVAHYETEGLHKDGRIIPVALTVSPIRDGAGGIIGASQIVQDRTEQRRAQEELRTLQAELVHLSRWNMMGMMASSLAHELNQPLTAMLNYVRAARRTLGDAPAEPRAVEFLDKAMEETKRAGGIIRSLREFIDKRETSRMPEDIGAVLEDSLVLSLYVGVEGRDKIQIRLAPGLPPVRMDRVQIQQVILNLVRNALEAMKEMPDGMLMIEAAADAGFVTISVADTGPGLAPEVASRLFQPFTTTKEQGMGVGLSICQSIVEAHGGKIWAEPNRPRGTIFRFRLPVGEDGGGV